MADLLDNIRNDIADRMKQLRPAVDEYNTDKKLLAIISGGYVADEEDPRLSSLKQRKRKQARRKAHNDEAQGKTVHKSKRPNVYLNDEQVAAMKQDARRKRIGLAKLMAKHGYVYDDHGWRVGA